MPVDTRLTYDDFCLLPNDGKRYEIIEGELFVTPAPRILHQKIVTRLAAALLTLVEREGLGQVFVAPVDIVFSDFDVVEPDIVYISKARTSVLTEKNVQGAPDLAIEVLSETTEKIDRTTKLKLYGRFGVQEYWIIDPDGPTAQIYRRGPQGLDLAATLTAADALTSPLFPGFSLPLTRLAE
jgi:Uma2 family endonuclease